MGKFPASGLFEPREVPATKTIKEVLQGGKWSKHVLAATTKPSADDKVDREVLERTMDEVAEGKAKGPYTEQEVDAILGTTWAPVRRIGLVQSTGVRPIDDFSEFGHNASSHTFEHVNLAGIDGVAGIAKTWMDAMATDTARVTLESGLGKEGEVHHEFWGAEARGLQGRAIDLRRAFKQLPIAPNMASVAVIVIWHPEVRAPRYFILRALPFGARNSAYAFGAVARTIERILSTLFCFLVEQYVDDYPPVRADSLVRRRLRTSWSCWGGMGS